MAIAIIPSCQLFWCWTDQVKHSKKTKNFFFFVPVPNSRCNYRDGTSKRKKKIRIQPYQSARKGVTKTYCAMYVIVKPKVVIGICIHIIKSGTLLCENIFVWAQLTDTWDYRHSTNDEVITKWTTAPSSNTVKTICDRAFGWLSHARKRLWGTLKACIAVVTHSRPQISAVNSVVMCAATRTLNEDET